MTWYMYDLKNPRTTPVTSGPALRFGVRYCWLII